MSEIATANPTPETPAANPSPEPVSSATGTVQPNGSEATGAAPSEETFYSGDPSSLPPELKQAYTNMLKDYKQKTSSVADLRKKAEAYDKVSKDQRFVDYYKGLNHEQKADYKEQKAEVEATLGQKITDERFQKAFETKDGFLDLIAEVAKEIGGKSQQKIEKLEKQLSVKDAEDTVESYATEVGQDGKPVRPDFYSLDDDKLISGFLQLNTDHSKSMSKQEYTEKLNEAYSWAKSVSQKYYEKGKSEALQIIQKKAASSSEPPTQAAKGAYTGPNPKNMSVRDAMELAKKGIKVPRDD